MSLVCGGDPGTESPGYAVWCTEHNGIVWAAATPPPFEVHVIACESGWPHGPIGKLGMWGLGFSAAWLMRDVLATSPDAECFTIAPKAWRAALGGLPANAPKAVIVARLRVLRYVKYDTSAWTDDVVEACGICEATAILLSRPLKKHRTGLKEVCR